MNLALEQQIERQTYWISFYSYFNKALSFLVVLDKFFTKTIKRSLQELLSYANELELAQEEILSLDRKELEKELVTLKKLTRLFDRINDKYSSSNYFGDEELRTTFKIISRKLHKTENLVNKRISKDLPFVKTPDYIKDQLAEFSRETLSNRIVK